MTIQDDIKNILRSEGGRPALTSNAAVPTMPSLPSPYIQHTLAADLLHNLNDIPEYDGDLSPIIISISSPVTVIGNGNLVAIDTDKTAISIAKAVARSLKDTSMSSVGVPMIDEDGRPRPIEVRIDVGVKIDGTKNTIGEQAVLAALQTSFNASKRKREEVAEATDSGEGLNGDKFKGFREIMDKEQSSASSTPRMVQNCSEDIIEDAKKQKVA